jgi:hypothetical protein
VSLAFSVLLGALFGILAGACAFVIAYSEYKRNWSFSGSATRMALRSAFVTFLVFLAAGILLPWLFQHVVSRP